MWEPRPLTTLWAFTACYRDSFTFYLFYLTSCKDNTVRTTNISSIKKLHSSGKMCKYYIISLLIQSTLFFNGPRSCATILFLWVHNLTSCFKLYIYSSWREIWDSHDDEYKDRPLLGCDNVCSGRGLPTFLLWRRIPLWIFTGLYGITSQRTIIAISVLIIRLIRNCKHPVSTLSRCLETIKCLYDYEYNVAGKRENNRILVKEDWLSCW
jgi:hypothetical protein